MFKMEVKSIFTIQKLFMVLEIFSFSMLWPYLARHFSYIEMLSGFVVLYAAPLIFIFFSKRIATKGFMLFAFIARYICILIFFVKPVLWIMYLFFFLKGIGIFFFWVPYNIRYFTFSHRMNRATSAGHFIIVGPILNLFIPISSAFVITRFGYPVLALISFIVLIVLLKRASQLPNFEVKYSFWDAFSKSKGLRTLKFLQGVWEGGTIMIPLFTLFFLKNEMAFGSFLSYLGLICIIATLFVTRFSDKQHKRMKFFFPLLVFLTLFTFSLAFADSLFKWVFVNALLGIASTLTYPFLYAILLDKIEDKSIAMITREFMINAGRVTGIAGIIIFGYLGLHLRHAFIFIGLSLVAYLVLLLWKGVYVEEAYYPLAPVAKVYDRSKNLVFKVYAWGKIVKIKEGAKIVRARLYTGTKWVGVSLRRISTIAGNKLARGKTSHLFRKIRD